MYVFVHVDDSFIQLRSLSYLIIDVFMSFCCANAQKALDQFLMPEARQLLDELQASTGPGFRRLNEAFASLVDDWSMISFSPLDYSDEESLPFVLSQV